MIDPQAIKLLQKYPKKFYPFVNIVKEDSSLGRLHLQNSQELVTDALQNFQHVYVVKYRQAKITTVGVSWLLQNIMYNPGLYGLLIAESAETCKEGFRRLNLAYDKLSPSIKVPATLNGSTHLQFSHNGSIKCITAGSKTPAIGRSPDFVHMTELCLWDNSEIAFSNIFPSFNKRPNAHSLIESTPGKKDSPAEKLWLSSLQGDSRYHPLFLKWWTDPSCTSDKDLTLSNDEYKLMERLEGATQRHMKFRRLCLDGEFLGDENLWENKYPSDEYSGFISSLNPKIPRQYIIDMVKNSRVGKRNEWGMEIFVEKSEGTPYMITADPAGYGEAGDDSAFTVWDCWKKCEVASYSGRLTPPDFADLLIKVKKYFNDALLVVESNAAGCISVLEKERIPVYSNKKDHPGFYTTAGNKEEALADFVRMLRDGEITVFSKATLHQALSFDGSWDRKGGHHYDRLITCLFAAYIFSTKSFGRPPVEKDTRLTVEKFVNFNKKQTPNPYR
jgi:hypothetical protein